MQSFGWSDNRSSTIVRLRWCKRSLCVLTTIPCAAGVVQELTGLGMPSISTMQSRQPPYGLSLGSWHSVGIMIPSSRAASRIVVSSATLTCISSMVRSIIVIGSGFKGSKVQVNGAWNAPCRAFYNTHTAWYFSTGSVLFCFFWCMLHLSFAVLPPCSGIRRIKINGGYDNFFITCMHKRQGKIRISDQDNQHRWGL